MHHIISDGWSMSVLIRELLSLYNACDQGVANPLPALRIHYKDYAVWQQEELSDSRAGHHAYWMEQFSGELPVLDVINDYPRPPIKTYAGAVVGKQLDPQLSAGLQALGREQGCTLFMVLLAGVNALLYRYTGKEDIIIGTPVAGREHADLEDQIGFYVNTLAIRTRFEGNASFRSLLSATKKVTLGAYAHQLYPFGELVESLQLQRDMSRNPLFDVQVILSHQQDHPSAELGQLVVKGYEGEQLQTSRFDIVFNFIETPQGLQLSLQYNTDLYRRASMVRLIAHLETCLRNIVSDPDINLSSIGYLTTEEQAWLMSSSHGPAIAYPASSNVLELFAEQVSLHPAAVAVQHEGVSLTYAALDAASNKLAHYLVSEYGLQAGELTGLMIDRSEKLLIAMLGILKAGGAYVPVDPDYPEARKSFLLQDSGVKVLITQTDYIFDLSYYQGAVFAIDVELETLPEQAAAPALGIEKEQPVYLIYTSGSTGNPKGVMITHGNLMHSLTARYHTYGAVTKFLLLSSYAFDSSVAGIFGTLCTGGCLCVPRKIDVANVSGVASHIISEEITHLLTVPGYYQLLLGILQERVNSLRAVIVAGESCPLQLIEQHHVSAMLEHCELYNEYGPTECTVWSTVYKYARGGPYPDTIGQPVANTEVYVLDGHLSLSAVGITGEIYIGGNGVSSGYLGRPELTAEKFIPHPFRAGARVYKTGDLGKWQTDGTLTFQGRRDEQVKVRGYRIELGEIENSLLGYPGVTAAVVTAIKNSEGLTELAAYVVGEERFSSSTLQGYLGSRLPSYSIPAHFIQLEQMPLTPNGKADRKRLPDPRQSAMGTGTDYVAPRNELEMQLVSVYEEVLKKTGIGIQDDFFVLGGDSIKSIQVVSRLKQRGYTLSIQDILLHPIVEAQAQRLKVSKRNADQGIISGEISLSPIQHWFFERPVPDRHHYNQSVLLHSTEILSETAIRALLNKITQHHDVLRMVFRHENNSWQQENLGKDQTCGFEVHDCADTASFERHCERIQSSFDLSAGPLFKAALFHRPDGDYLLLVCHHLIIDGVSWRILFEDICQLYEQYQAGLSLQLPQKSDSFKYWQQQQLAFAGSAALQQERNYWSGLATVPVTPLRLDIPDGSNLVGDAGNAFFVLDKTATQQLTTQCYQAYRTEINDILLTCLGLSMQEVLGQQQLLVNMEGHGREEIGGDVSVARTVGWFTTIYPVLIDMRYGQDAVRQLISVKETLHRIPNKGIGYGILRYLCGQDAGLRRK
jgi:amino acid adenylation domain-containing protein